MANTLSLWRRYGYLTTGAVAYLILSLVTACSEFSQVDNTSIILDFSANATAKKSVIAVGRLKPQGEILQLSVANAPESRVKELLVKQGDRVSSQQLIAILQGLDKKQAELAQAKQQVVLYQAKLAKIKSGELQAAASATQKARISDLETQLRTETSAREADITTAKTQLQQAESDYQRYQNLHQQGAETAQNLNNAQLALQAAQANLEQAQSRLDSTIATLKGQIIQEQGLLQQLMVVNPGDIQQAQAELDYVAAKVKHLEAELEDFYLRAPIAGQILQIHTHAGERINLNRGIVELAQTDQMYAIAQVPETDVGKIKQGQKATITSKNGGFSGKLNGVVEQIGLQAQPSNFSNTNAQKDRDIQVVEVKVRLNREDSAKVAKLINLQVKVKIALNSTNRN